MQAISICAVILQIIADKQMRDFKKNILNKNKIMNLGLWKYSRHPNYLGEVMFWIGLYVIALSVDDLPFWLFYHLYQCLFYLYLYHVL